MNSKLAAWIGRQLSPSQRDALKRVAREDGAVSLNDANARGASYYALHEKGLLDIEGGVSSGGGTGSTEVLSTWILNDDGEQVAATIQ